MPSGAHLVAFAITAAVLIAIPGPSVLFTVGRALTVGRRPALLNVVGNTAGAYTQAMAVAVGLGAVVAASSEVYTAIKLAGAAYLVFLGIQAIRHRRVAVEGAPAAPTRRDSGAYVRQGFIVGVTNPKVLVLFVAAMPQFVDPDRTVWTQVAVFGLVFALLALISDTIWALAASSARTWFARSPRRIAGVNAGGGGLMIGLGIKVAVSGRPD
jgi:threonine/homoserine/homoserine lactone efflux protein